MIDTDAIARMVEEQIVKTVNDQVLAVLTSDEWVKPLEQKIIKSTSVIQDKQLNKGGVVIVRMLFQVNMIINL
jgi:hypothetical protein